jgi:plasmid replication initiation protein
MAFCKKVEKVAKHPTRFHRNANNFQSNAITKSRQDFTLIERKIVAMVINQIMRKKDYPEGYSISFEIPISELSPFADFKDLKKACISLFDKKIVFEDKDIGSFGMIRPFPEVTYNHKKNGLIELVLYSKVVPLFVELGNEYTKYDLETFLSLKSVYSQRIYEMLMMERRGGAVKTFKIGIKSLMSRLDCEHYADYYQFNRRVLKPAQAELFEKADFVFEYAPSKKDKKEIIELEFTMKSAVEVQFEAIQSKVEDFHDLGLETKYHVASNLLDKYYTFTAKQREKILLDPVVTAEFIQIHVEIEKDKRKVVKNITSYMATCLGMNKKKSQ